MAKTKPVVDPELVQPEVTVDDKEVPKSTQDAQPAQEGSPQVHQATSVDTATAETADVASTPSSGDLELADELDNDDDDEVGGLDDVGSSTIAVDIYRYLPRAAGQHVSCGTYCVGPQGVDSPGMPHEGLEPYVGWLLTREVITK